MTRPTLEQYEAWCRAHSEPADLAKWDVLWDVLNQRPHWRLEPPDSTIPPGPLWAFGPPPGTAHLVLTVVSNQFVLYHADTDTDTRYDGLDGLLTWLDENEGRHLQYTEGERAMFEHLYGEVGMPDDDDRRTP